MVTTLQEKQIQAQNLQERGLLRRALALWNEIARSDDSELMPVARTSNRRLPTCWRSKK